MLNASKIPLVFLPGSLCDEALWAAQTAALSDVAAVQIAHWEGRDTVAAMAEAVLTSIEHQAFALAGFSLGGFVALEIARRAAYRVLGLALLDTSARPDPLENLARREANIRDFTNNPAPVLDRFAALTLGPSTSAEIASRIRATMARRAAAFYIDEQRAMMSRPDARDGLCAITCPTLVLCGGEDRATPLEVSREMAGAIAGATLVELPGIGHMTPLEAPQKVNHALREWLLRITPPDELGSGKREARATA